MPIPERLVFKVPSERAVREFRNLCDEIENRILGSEDASELLARWNARANRVFTPSDFTNFHGALDADDFVREALLPRPEFVSDLSYAELRAVFEGVLMATLEDEAAHSYFLDWLEIQLPGAEVSDLIYWPNQWFGAPQALQLDLSADQLIRAAMERSGRILPDAPAVGCPSEETSARHSGPRTVAEAEPTHAALSNARAACVAPRCLR